MAAPTTAAASPPRSAATPSPEPHHVLVATALATGPEAPAQARQVVRDLLAQGRRPELSDMACLLTSELVSNAVVHGEGNPVELVVDLDQRRLSVQVGDASAGEPVPVLAGPLSTSGRGLAMVDHLADSWGVTRRRRGKSVWFALANPA
ncbi:MAG TPA: ATP-binding protein [Acidimicrobiales bacterium]|nr:ATP-binding protein [Acidimicrobiales bacterium]